MCGIVGYVGDRQAWPIILEGLQRLEYRGYDSAGIAVVDAEGIMQVRKTVGKVDGLALAHHDPLDVAPDPLRQRLNQRGRSVGRRRQSLLRNRHLGIQCPGPQPSRAACAPPNRPKTDPCIRPAARRLL